jgi:hypothetical protein
MSSFVTVSFGLSVLKERLRIYQTSGTDAIRASPNLNCMDLTLFDITVDGPAMHIDKSCSPSDPDQRRKITAQGAPGFIARSKSIGHNSPPVPPGDVFRRIPHCLNRRNST